jgi:hypothetical protein
MADETLTVDEAVAMLAVVEYDPGGEGGRGPCVHTFRDSAIGLLGAHWRLDAVREAMEKFGVERSGDVAAGMSHGLVLRDQTSPVFLETKAEA